MTPPASPDKAMSDSRALLSSKPIAAVDRLILALDIPSVEEARALVSRLGPSVTFYKIGLELFMAGGYFELLDWLADQGKKVFVDLKFFDVPQTVGSAVRQLAKRRATLATVHGNDAILAAACAEKGPLGILAVTVLTSLDQGDMQALGCDGIVSSGLEVSTIRRELGDKLVVVVPGIRPTFNRPAADQKRTVDVEDALLAGADHIVIGRPMRADDDPRAAAEAVQERIARLFAG